MVEVDGPLRRLPLLAAHSLTLLLWLWLGTIASAHRLDEYLQATLVVIAPHDIRLQINFTPGVEVANKVLALLDRDGDGTISAREKASYAQSLQHDLAVQIDRHPVKLNLTASSFDEPGELRTGSGLIQLEYQVQPSPAAPGLHHLTLENRHLAELSVYLFNAAKPRSDSVRIISQKRNQNQSTGEIAFTLQ